jgi:hypothetical protein
MASAALPEAVEPGKKGNVRFAFACAILASMTSILLGYGTNTRLSLSVNQCFFSQTKLALASAAEETDGSISFCFFAWAWAHDVRPVFALQISE